MDAGRSFLETQYGIARIILHKEQTLEEMDGGSQPPEKDFIQIIAMNAKIKTHEIPTKEIRKEAQA